ncbi:MAG: hypothetical protein LBU65_03045 [Planctomycetaceae bacterium]|jgi:hypothetical protein|nr:hypothetical protein [Planctomycetaceae bacterium]
MKTHIFLTGRFLFALLAMCFVFGLFCCSHLQAQQRYVVRSLEPGDVILSVNGESISGAHGLADAVNRSSREMVFQVRDSRTGKITQARVTLNPGEYRLGVYSKDTPGGGARITSLMPGSAASHCLIDMVNTPPQYSREELLRKIQGAQNLLRTETNSGKRQRIQYDLRQFEVSLAALDSPTPLPDTVKIPNNNSNDNIQILLIYGTLDNNVMPATSVSRQKIQSTLREANLLENDSDTTRSGTQTYQTTLDGKSITVRTLDGYNASPNTILSVCREMSTQTGTNGAIMVFYLGHGGVQEEKHTLFPLAISAVNSQTGKADVDLKIADGVKREDIWKVLTVNNHRATFLITDSCTLVVPSPLPSPKLGNDAHVTGRPLGHCNLTAMLLYYRGVLDLNSADPSSEQVALGNKDYGAYFSSAFAICASKKRTEPNTFSDTDLNTLFQDSQDTEHREVIKVIKSGIGVNESANKKQQVYVFHGNIRIINNWDSIRKE